MIAHEMMERVALAALCAALGVPDAHPDAEHPVYRAVMDELAAIERVPEAYVFAEYPKMVTPPDASEPVMVDSAEEEARVMGKAEANGEPNQLEHGNEP